MVLPPIHAVPSVITASVLFKPFDRPINSEISSVVRMSVTLYWATSSTCICSRMSWGKSRKKKSRLSKALARLWWDCCDDEVVEFKLFLLRLIICRRSSFWFLSCLPPFLCQSTRYCFARSLPIICIFTIESHSIVAFNAPSACWTSISCISWHMSIVLRHRPPGSKIDSIQSLSLPPSCCLLNSNHSCAPSFTERTVRLPSWPCLIDLSRIGKAECNCWIVNVQRQVRRPII